MCRILILDDEPMHRLGVNRLIHMPKPDYPWLKRYFVKSIVPGAVKQ